MQSGPRMVMPTAPHLPHGMNPPMDNNALQQQHMVMMGQNGQRIAFDPNNMSDEHRAMIEGQLRMQQAQQQAQAQQQGREAKVAGQRTLGVATPQQTPRHMIQHPQLLQGLQAQGIRQVMTAQGTVMFLDAQGRQVHLNQGWQGDPRQPMTMQQQQTMTQQQHHAMQQQQHLMAQMQPQMQQQRQQQQPQQQPQMAQQLYTPQQTQMMQRPQVMHQQQALQNQQAAQQRASQPPSARPPAASLPTPSLLQVPPPPVMKQRPVHEASRSASPMPPHMRMPQQQHPQPATHMQPSNSAIAGVGQSPAILPARASTIQPSMSDSHLQRQSVPPQSHPQQNVAQTIAIPRQPTPQLEPMRWSKTLVLSSQQRLERWKQKTARLESMLADAKLGLAEMEKEEQDGKKRAESRARDPKAEFEKEVLGYLRRAGYESTVAALEGEMKQPASEKEVIKSSPKSSPNANAQASSSTPAETTSAKEVPETDSIFGTEVGEDGKMEVDKEKADEGETSKDLGELFTWWILYQDTRVLLANKPHLFQPPSSLAATSTQPDPSSATAIALSVPSSAPPHPGQHLNGVVPNEAQLKLQQAEEMRQAQQAHIAAQQESLRRQAAGQGQPQHQQPGQPQHQPEQRILVQIAGQNHSLTQEEYQRLVQQNQQQQQFFAQQQHQQQQQQQQMMMSNGQMYPGQMQHPHSSPSKRKREMEEAAAANKHPKIGGQQPTPDEHRKQAVELARTVSGQMTPQVGHNYDPDQSPAGQLSDRRTSLSEAQRQYAATQAAYARQNLERTSVGNSPATFNGVSPAQLGQSPMAGSPAQGGEGVNGINQAPTPASAKGKKGKSGLVVDTELTPAESDAPPTSTPKGRKTPNTGKRPPRAAAEKTVKGKKVRFPSSAPMQDQWQQWLTLIPKFQGKRGAANNTTATPGQEGEEPQTPAVAQTPGSTQTQVYQLPVQTPSEEQPPLDPQLTSSAPPQPDPAQIHDQSQPSQPPAQMQGLPPSHNQFEAPAFEFDDSNDLFKMLDFSGGEGGGFDGADVFNFDGFAFPGVSGEGQEDWQAIESSSR
ncbi:hypothetical protein IAR50_001813 [Cryptococcus sp. DSM 104548]